MTVADVYGPPRKETHVPANSARMLRPHRHPDPRSVAVSLVILAACLSCGSEYALEANTQPINTGGGWTFLSDATTDAAQDVGGAPGLTDVAATDVALQDGQSEVGAAGDADSASLDVWIGLDSASNSDVGCAAPCTVSADCTANVANVCTLSLCIAGCCKSAAAPADSACDDGDLCTKGDQCGVDGSCAGAPIVCDDNLLCTADSCDPTSGSCAHSAVAGHCAIGASCVLAGTVEAGKPCSVCDPTLTASAWSAKPGCCGQDSDCPTANVCDAPSCDAATGTCKPGKKLGCCSVDVECSDGNPCTLDVCDVATGNCKITPKTCTDASSCQQGVCDGSSGVCQQAMKAGWCLIGGACIASGQAKPGSACESCAPASQAASWTIMTGAQCDDGDVCTNSDACDAAGSCSGVAATGCCKSHLDCAKLNTACTTATCDLQGHVCIKATQPGCCEGGACCDPATNKLKTAKTLCGGAMAGYDYQCSGQQIQRRNVYPGCSGLDATTCTAEAQFAYMGPWTGLSTCPSNTLCTTTAPSVMPTCKAKEPTGTCNGACGGAAADGTCQCGASCTTLGNCCKDFTSSCGCTSGACCDVAKKFLMPPGKACASATEFSCSGQIIRKRTSSAVCSGTSSVCPVGSWGAWANVSTCGTGTVCTVAADKTSASCKAAGGSCAGICGKQAATGCWCDDKCAGFGDCCTDFAKTCACGGNPLLTCKGTCGSKGAGGCWCDALCVDLGDCCGDRTACCGP